MKPTVEGFDSFHSPRLSPAKGLESDAALFTAPPIESLELLKELGDIAAASIFAPEPTETVHSTEAAPAVQATEPKTSDERLLEALLDYHRHRGPKLGARTAPRPSADTNFSRTDASTESGERFASVEIPVVQDFVPKSSPGGIRASRPVQTILKPKPKP